MNKMMNSLANPKSPVYGFHTGNMDTLYTEPKAKGIDPVEELKKFFKANYCAPRMRLVTFSQMPLDEQLIDSVSNFADLTTPPECSKDAPSFASPKAYPPD